MSKPRYGGAIRDPIHGYIPLTATELRLLDCVEVQRLRHIAQLGLTQWVYPGARHSRFEHALGTLHVASRVFEEMRGRLGVARCLRPLGVDPNEREFEHLQDTARCVALLHDLGHAPFSHVTEELLPALSRSPTSSNGDTSGATTTSHEALTVELATQGSVGDCLRQCDPALYEDVLSVLRALATPNEGEPQLSAPLAFVAHVIAGPIGADRMDYLLRDSAATGVNYGLFDLQRVLHTVIPVTPTAEGAAASASSVQLGIERGGAMAVEGLWAGRESMFEQVYRHHTRRILDRHLLDFLREVLPEGRYPREPHEYLQWNDPRVWEELRRADADSSCGGHAHAQKILRRQHHRLLPQEVHGADRTRVSELLDGWKARIRADVSDADPISDVISLETRGAEIIWCEEPTGELVKLGAWHSGIAVDNAPFRSARTPCKGRMYVRRQALGIPRFEQLGEDSP